MSNTIGQICSRFSSGDTITTKSIQTKGKYPVYGGNGLRGYTDSYNFDGECAIIGRQGAKCGNVRYFKGKAFMTEHAIIAVANKDNSSGYLSYKLQQMNLNRYQGQSAQPGLSVKTLSDVPISMPPLKVQENIFDILNTISIKIENNNKIIFTLESLAKTIYDYWFLQFEFPNEDGKPYKSSGGKMVLDEELKREIPEGWEVKKIKDCIQHINTGLNPRKNFVLNEGGDVKYITVKNLTTNGIIDFSGCDMITKEVKELINKRSMIKKGDILFASIAPLGRCYLMYETPEDWEINESVFSIRPNYRIVNSEYLYMFFMSDWFVKKAEHASTGSIFNGIRISTLEDTYIVVPPKSVLDIFKTTVEPLYKSKFNSVNENQELTSLQDFLLPMLMNGQVTFKE